MLVYGDAVRRLSADHVLDLVRWAMERAVAGTGLARHEALVEALIEAGALAQAVADAHFAAREQVDDRDAVTEAAFLLARAIAAGVVSSWRGALGTLDPLQARVSERLAALGRHGLPNELVLREPEGFLHYAVYPEAYAEAAQAIPAGPLCVVGLRSIGTTLAAMVAAARSDVKLALTLRPVGHPFRREIRMSPALRSEIAAHSKACRFAIVDEGPGLSGSSMAATITELEALGVPPGHIHVLPSHDGEPGPEADEAVRRAWFRVARHVVSFNDLVLRPGRLEAWCTDIAGVACGSPQEVSGGAWRNALGLAEVDWPPANPWRERRKFVLRTQTGEWLLRFAGLGRAGREKRELAVRLHGFVPELAGLRHGFLIERWHGSARPLEASSPAFLTLLNGYLALRATLAPPPGSEGASLRELHEMLLHNTGEALGTEARSAAEREWGQKLESLAAGLRPVAIDGKLQVWEWIGADGRLLKTDALDHHAGHDLIGVQDITWDVAGAAVEYNLGQSDMVRLIQAVERASGRAIREDLLRFMMAAYCAFQLGCWTMTGNTGDEAERIGTVRRRYAEALASCLRARMNDRDV